MPKKSSIQQVREKLGLTAEQLGGILGISRSYYSMSEKGMRNFSAEALIFLSKLEIATAKAEAAMPPAMQSLGIEALMQANHISEWAFLSPEAETELKLRLATHAKRCRQKAERCQAMLNREAKAIEAGAIGAALSKALKTQYANPTEQESKLFETLDAVNIAQLKSRRAKALLNFLKLKWKRQWLISEAEATERFIANPRPL